MTETRELLTSRWPELDARRKALIERLMETCEHFDGLLNVTPTSAVAAAAYSRAAGDAEAIFVEQAWEALDGKPRLLESVPVAIRKMRAAGRGDGGPVLAGLLEQARGMRQQAAVVGGAIAAGVANLVDGRALLASTAAAHAASTMMAAEAVGDEAAHALAQAFLARAEHLHGDLDRERGPDVAALDLVPPTLAPGERILTFDQGEVLARGVANDTTSGSAPA